MRKTSITVIIISILLISMLSFLPIKLSYGYSSTNRVTILSPQNNETYYKDSVLVNFEVKAFYELDYVGYSLDEGPMERIANLTFLKSEPAPGIVYLDDVYYSGDLRLSDLENGNHFVIIYQGSMYSDGFHENARDSVNFTVNSAPPNILNLSIKDRTYNQTALPLTFTIDKQFSWAGYSLDNQDNVTLTGNSTLYSISDGAHSIVIYANDTAGNMGKSTPVQFTIETKSNPTQLTTPTPTPTPEPTATAIPTPSTAQQPAQKPETSGNSNNPFEIGIVVAISIVAAVVAVGTVIALRRRRRKHLSN